MDQKGKRRFQIVGLIAVLLVWAHGAFTSLTDPGVMQEIARTTWSLLLYTTTHSLVLLALIAILFRFGDERFRDLGFRARGCGSALAVGSLYGIGLVLLNAVLSPVLSALLPASASAGIDLSQLVNDWRHYPVWVLMAIFRGGFFEELWRIFGLTRFEKLFGTPGLVAATLVGSIVFGINHSYQGVDTVITTGIQAVLFVLMYLRRRNAWEPVVAHAVYDLISITAAFAVYA